MFTFGAGVLIGTPTQDGSGNAIAANVRSPIQFGILQEVTVEESWEAKTLYGAQQFPVDVGRGKGSVSIKAKAARINAALMNAWLFGQTSVTGYAAVYDDLTGTAIPGTAGGGNNVTVVPPNSGTFGYDLGVSDANGVPYTRVASAPTTGQYTVNATGGYVFSGLDITKTVYIRYEYTNATSPSSARAITVANLPMGYAPFFQLDLMAQKNGKTYYMRYPQAMSTKITRNFKNDDYTIPEIDIQCFADATGNISYQYLSE